LFGGFQCWYWRQYRPLPFALTTSMFIAWHGWSERCRRIILYTTSLSTYCFSRPCVLFGSCAGLFPFVYIILEKRDTWETVISESRRVRLFSEQTLSFSPVYRKFFSTLPCLFHGMNQQMYHSTPCGDGLLLSSLFPWAIKSTQPPALYILSTRHILPTRTMTE
jgi:hypothetical protein